LLLNPGEKKMEEKKERNLQVLVGSEYAFRTDTSQTGLPQSPTRGEGDSKKCKGGETVRI